MAAVTTVERDIVNLFYFSNKLFISNVFQYCDQLWKLNERSIICMREKNMVLEAGGWLAASFPPSRIHQPEIKTSIRS